MTKETGGHSKLDGRPIVFFDGVCGLCNTAVDWLLVRDRHQRLLYAPLQGSTAAECLEPIDREQMDSIVLFHQGRSLRKSAAVLETLRYLPAPWPIIGRALSIVPRSLRDLVYTLIATYRYRVFGMKDVCRIPTPQERARFLD